MQCAHFFLNVRTLKMNAAGSHEHTRKCMPNLDDSLKTTCMLIMNSPTFNTPYNTMKGYPIRQQVGIEVPQINELIHNKYNIWICESDCIDNIHHLRHEIVTSVAFSIEICLCSSSM